MDEQHRVRAIPGTPSATESLGRDDLEERGCSLRRLGTLMAPADQDPHESLGVLNPGAVRSENGQLYLFPRVVQDGNYSRIGLCKVQFDGAGDPVGVERLGIVLEPSAEYELNTRTGGGCEDPRVTFVPALGCYVMAYVAFSNEGPRLALAVSNDLFQWERLGLVQFRGPNSGRLNNCGNKDGMFLAVPVSSPSGVPSLAFLHRPMPWTGMRHFPEQIWVSYCPLSDLHSGVGGLVNLQEHQVLMSSMESWEAIKLGAGAPPVLTSAGWLVVYHGVGLAPAGDAHPFRYCAGLAVLDRERPWIVRSRLTAPLFEPEMDDEQQGVVPNVVFPTGIDHRTDLEGASRFDVYYGMADSRIGVISVTLPWVEELSEEEAA